MGRRGPGKTPTNLAVVRGQRKDRINLNEPKPSVRDVVAPEWLDGEALQIWGEYAPDMIRVGVLTAWDVEAFAAWCDAASRRRRAVAALESEGEVVDLPVFNKNGELTGHRRGKSPWTFVLNEATAQLVTLGTRFGLTPSDRAGLTLGKRDREPGADLLSG